MANIAVIDIETTGFGRQDRVVEIGVVVADLHSLEVHAEFDSLVNPLRDVGPTQVHGITASMVEAAPTFEEVASAIAALIDGSVLVAHNLAFDQRFLRTEFDRVGVDLDAGRGLCTLRMSGERLDLACTRHGIALAEHHRALADARATLALYNAIRSDEQGIPASASWTSYPRVPRTLRREAVAGASMPAISHKFPTPYPTTAANALSYLATVDHFLSDLVLTPEERAALSDLSRELGIDGEQQARLHEDYFAALAAAAVRDGVVTAQEHHLLQSVAFALDINSALVPEETLLPGAPSDWVGCRVCFTGTAVVDGGVVERSALELLAATHGLQPVATVSKKGCDLLVAADPSSSSGKARKARDYGIPVISVEEFVSRLA